MCALLEIVDTTIVNVALNDMKGNLGASTSEVGWVVTAYAIGNVIIIPMTSWFSQQFGRRNYFAASIMMFTLCSFLCGNANGIWELVVFRFIQGVGGGALLVTSQTIITESYPPEKRGMAQAIYGLGVIIGPTLGPPLGGYIVDHSSWPYIFYINIPIGVIATLLTLQFVRSPKYGEKSSAKDIDWLGIGLLAICVGSLQYVLEKGQDDDWFRIPAITSSVGYSISWFFLFHLARTYLSQPDRRTAGIEKWKPASRNHSFIYHGFWFIRFYFHHTLYTQSTLGWTAQQAGMLMIPAAITTAFMMPMIGQIAAKRCSQAIPGCAGHVIVFCLFVLGI